MITFSTYISIPIGVTDLTQRTFATARTVNGFIGRFGPLVNVPQPPVNQITQTGDFLADFGQATLDQTGTLARAQNYIDFIDHLRTQATVGRPGAQNSYIWIQFQMTDQNNNPSNSPYLIMRLDDYYITHFSIFTAGGPVIGAAQLFTAILDTAYGETFRIPDLRDPQVDKNMRLNKKQAPIK